MLRRLALLTVILSMSTLPLAAVSNPPIAGQIAGVELCPQSLCGRAIFLGNFVGLVNGNPASGTFWTGVTHEDLPTSVNPISAVTGGSWLIRTRLRTFAGHIQGGTLTFLPNNTFAVTLTLELEWGGSGTLAFHGLLNHNPFPPTIVGIVTQ